METNRVAARDAALQLLNRLTFGFAAAALAGVGVFAAVGAATIPGNASSSTTSSSASSTSAQTSSSNTSSSTSLQPSSGGVSSAQSGSGTVATGASR